MSPFLTAPRCKQKHLVALVSAIVLAISGTNLLHPKIGHLAPRPEPIALPDVPRRRDEPSLSPEERRDECTALRSHMSGRWEHFYLFAGHSNNGSESPLSPSSTLASKSKIARSYLPQEIEWLEARNKTHFPWKACSPNSSNSGEMYVSLIGNQCGRCASHAFLPSHSVWLSDVAENETAAGLNHDQRNQNDNQNYNQNYNQNNNQNDNEPDSPSLRLVQRLARSNQTLCFAGDSIDFQIYDALRNNLNRISLLRQASEQDIPVSVPVQILLESRVVPVQYTNDTGTPPRRGYMAMADIKETLVSLTYRNGTIHQMTLRYFRTYGWSPWNTAFMDDCNVIVMNLGLHYLPHDAMGGLHWGHPRLMDDFRAAITYLVDFVSSRKNRVAIWRSALPQHFDTNDRHYEYGVSESNKACIPIPETMIHNNIIQNYNKVYEQVFAMLCHSPPRYQHHNKSLTQSCDHLKLTCTVDRMSLEYRTEYKFLTENNCTGQLKHFLTRHDEHGQLSKTTMITGNILRWEIANLFNVASWHIDDSDCSHFCYIPSLFEAAFERLDMLLSLFFIPSS